jgi:hypothetical protein
VRQVAHILQPLVLSAPMPVVQHRVIRVVPANTMLNKDNQVAHHAALGNTTTNKDKVPNLVVKTIAMLVPTSNSIKLHV